MLHAVFQVSEEWIEFPATNKLNKRVGSPIPSRVYSNVIEIGANYNKRSLSEEYN
jgi:hypothetical protein